MRDMGCSKRGKFFAGAFALILLMVATSLRADQIDMQNGDRYVGKVVSLNANTLVVQNEVLGVVRIPRDKVASISFGSAMVTAKPAVTVATAPIDAAPPAAPAQPAPQAANPFRDLAAHTNLIHKIQSQFLSDAGPEANKQFEDMLNGLMTGKLNMDDLRAQAQSAADQIRALKRDSGEDPGFAADSYLAILDQFLKSTPASAGSKTNAPAAAQKTKPGAAEEEN
jgi:hypothetical protein